ncbi:MAG: DUF4465 domain-containing protein [Bacteroidia bacterium]|nr:DUF4465 domain-containing protein [Bacteroidia bacterium]
MKKVTFLMTALLLSAFAQLMAQTATFDDLTLQPDSFWNGSDLSGGFYNANCYFVNYYDTSFGGSWSGFAYSNKTDSITAGYTNMYSVMAGHAYSGNNFTVAYVNSFTTTYVRLPDSVYNVVFYVTNSTYAYISMRDGDAFAKKFGGTSGNDPDWFKLTVDGYNNGIFTDSAEFYLADFRFNNSQDYILKDWDIFDLSLLGVVDSLVFRLSSSDVGLWGMNTPAYFCMENLMTMPVSVEEATKKSDINIFPNPCINLATIDIAGKIDRLVIRNITGKTLLEFNKPDIRQIDVSILPDGVYVLEISFNNKTIMQKMIKQ